MNPTSPNILWIVTTQWRASATGFSGDPNAVTPQLDALARESVNFAQAVTPHPFGPFARAAMLTGVSSPQNGVRDYYDPLPLHSRTVAHEWEDRGYATAFFGKWHLADRDRSVPLVGEAHARMIVPPAARGGFGFWEGFEGGFLLNDPWLQGTRLPEPVRFPGYQSDVLSERAAGWLAARPTSQPCFCVVSFEAPHPPYLTPVPDGARRDPDSLALSPNVPRGGEAEAKARTELAGYYAHITATDAAIGRLLAALSSAEAAGARPTVIVFTSVHGDMHGAHGLFRKGWPHEESVRVPLLVRIRGVTPRRDPAAVSLRDLSRLTAAWAGFESTSIPAPRHADLSMPSVVALPYQCDRVWRGIRTPARKLVLNADGTPWLFFDLEHDPFERYNLIQVPARAGELQDMRELMAGA